MKRSLLVVCAFVFAGWGLMAWAENGDVPHTPDPDVARSMGYRTLANGAVIYEETAEDTNVSLEDIAPAAGGEDGANPAEPQFKYDPLTQTYRRISVDRTGNSRQDVINTNDR